MNKIYHEIVSSASGGDRTAFPVHATDHVDEIDVGVFLALLDITKGPLSAVVGVLYELRNWIKNKEMM